MFHTEVPKKAHALAWFSLSRLFLLSSLAVSLEQNPGQREIGGDGKRGLLIILLPDEAVQVCASMHS